MANNPAMENGKPVNTKGIIGVAISTSLVTTFLGTSLNISIPNIGSEFDCSAVILGWVVTIYTLLTSAFSVPFGRLADLHGRKQFMILGLAIVGGTSLVSFFSWSIASLIILRGIQAIGASMIFSTNVSIALAACPPSMRGQILGLSSTAAYIGLSCGPVIGGLLNEYVSWRFLFLIPFAIAVVVMIQAYRILPNDKHQSDPGSGDLSGNVLFVGMIMSLLFGMTTLNTLSYSKIFIVLGIVLAIFFWKREMKFHAPVVKVRLFKEDRVYLCANVVVLLNFGVTFGLSYALAIYLQVVRGMDSQLSGLFMACQPLMMAIFASFAGKMADRHNPFKLVTFGLVICLCSTAVLLFLQDGFPVWGIAVSQLTLGIGTAFFSPPNNSIAMGRVDRKDYGVASSLISTFRTMGNSVIMVVITLVVAAHLGQGTLADASPTELTEMMHTIFIVMTVMACSALVLSFVGRPSKKVK